MNKNSTLHLNKHEIFLWKDGHSLNNKYSSCPLKYYLNFVRYLKVENPIDFVYVPKEVQLIPNLTLKENLFLEGLPSSLSVSKEFILQEFLASKANESIFQIFKKIPCLDLYPHEVEIYQQKMVCLLVALLKDSEFLFLEDPLLHFPSRLNILHHLKNILIQQSQEKARMIIIHTDNILQWEDILTHTINRSSQGHFLITPFEKTKDSQLPLKWAKTANYPDDSNLEYEKNSYIEHGSDLLHFHNFSPFILKSKKEDK